MVAKFFAPNLEMAHVLPLGATGGIRPARRIHKRIPELFPVRCAECRETFFTHNVRKKFCNEKCMNTHHVKAHRRRRTVRQNAEAKAAKNKDWVEFYTNDIFNPGVIPPPKLNGRPTRIQRAAIDEFKKLNAIRLRRRNAEEVQVSRLRQPID